MTRHAAILFDLGNTLAAYYRKEEFNPVLQRCVAAASRELTRMGLPAPTPEIAFAAALQQNREAADHRFLPLSPRLQRIFGVDVVTADMLCNAFMQPIFATASLYDDSLAVLSALKQRGVKTAIVSNSPWGSSPALWRNEMQRLGLAPLVDAVVLCGDVGWRKPAPQIFKHAAAQLDVDCARCSFVGDDVQWDIEGSAAVGMQPVLLDRMGLHPDHMGTRITGLHQLL
ncbi:MAG TPA: HAD family hydrolase [Candidatus Acidoferrum sp.]|nr:HAD family hydrolase [Candidatus Acidoferrum sp.]